MLTLFRIAPLAALLALTACATPRERCLADATRDLRVVDELINETRANLQRGYAVRTVSEPDTFWRLCLGTGHRHGTGAQFCRSTRWVERSEPVAVNLDEERRKLQSLTSKRQELVKTAALAQARCPAG